MNRILYILDAFLGAFVEWCWEYPFISLPLGVAALITISVLMADPAPPLAEGVLEVTKVECGIASEENELISCLVEVKAPETTKLVKTEYLLMLEPGEELAVPVEAEE